MTDTPSTVGPKQNPHCPECGAVNYQGRQTCYICGRVFTEAERANLLPMGSVASPVAEGTLPPPLPRSGGTSSVDRRGPATYTLSTLFLFVTLACVFCGLIAAAPGLGIPLAVLVTPALIRTMFASRMKQSQGLPVTVENKIEAFALSFGLMILVTIAAGAAFFAACSAVCVSVEGAKGMSDNAKVTLGLGAGALAGIVVGILILVRTWPRRKKKQFHSQ